jgi:hypothetical protein
MISRKVEALLDKYAPKVYRSKEVSDTILKEMGLNSYEDAKRAASEYKKVVTSPWYVKFEMYMEKYGYKEQVDICLEAHRTGVLPSDVTGKTASLLNRYLKTVIVVHLIRLVLKALAIPLKAILLPFSKGEQQVVLGGSGCLS